jgi:hypothetical protein
MKYGEYLETNMVKEWEDNYVSYKKLKKILKILSAQLLTKPPTEWTIGVSLSTPAPTNAAAMPVGGESESESTEGDAPERVTENDFFKVGGAYAQHADPTRSLAARRAYVFMYIKP